VSIFPTVRIYRTFDYGAELLSCVVYATLHLFKNSVCLETAL